ncbi:glycerol uptake facilitator protein [Lachnospiraceae bacterium KH1T2]|nr:glycerol uptake facilitator protein [Lachnospiraceae bacterium KH1T2]
MKYFLAEFIGTAILVVLGDGVCCNVSLNKSGMKGGNSVHITIGWALAVLLPAFCFGASSGAHFNPSVTIALAVGGMLDWSLVPTYIIGQLLGGVLGAVILIILYHDQLVATDDPAVKRGCFCTGPSSPNTVLNFLSECTCGFLLVFTILGINQVAGGAAGTQGLNYFFVMALIMSIGMSLGGLTGYAMNAARDTAPRLAYALFCPGKKDADWGYAWIPALAPIVGACLAALLYNALIAAGVFA